MFNFAASQIRAEDLTEGLHPFAEQIKKMVEKRIKKIDDHKFKIHESCVKIKKVLLHTLYCFSFCLVSLSDTTHQPQKSEVKIKCQRKHKINKNRRENTLRKRPRHPSPRPDLTWQRHKTSQINKTPSTKGHCYVTSEREIPLS